METLIIQIPEKKITLVKQLLKELGVGISKVPKTKADKPNKLTAKTIDNARNGVGLGEPITDVAGFINSI